MLPDGQPVESLGVVHDEMVLPVHVEDEDDVVLSGPEGEEAQHGDPGLAGDLLAVDDAAEEVVESLREDPGALVLDDPVLHLTQPLLLLLGTQGHDRADQVLEIGNLLERRRKTFRKFYL